MSVSFFMLSALLIPMHVHLTMQLLYETLSWAKHGTQSQAPGRTRMLQARRIRGTLCKMPSGAWQNPVWTPPLP